MKKFFVLLLALCISFSCVACGARGGQEDYGDKLVLNVLNFNGGFGSEWLYKAAARFEEKYKDEVFAEGYKGVKIVPDLIKSGTADLQDTILSSADDVFFTEMFLAKRYYDQNALLDISDIVNEKLTAYGEDKSIADKMYDEDKSYYAFNGKYYGIPHYEGYMGISYNVDMFETELCYFKQGGGFITSLSDTKANGPDGQPNTFDDGLPATMDEFIELCARLKSKGISPVSWSGDCQDYFTRFLSSLWANDAGVDTIKLIFTMAGQASGIAKSISNDGTPSFEDPQPVIDNTNAYLLQTHIGKYYALDLAEKIIKNNYYSQNAFAQGTHSNLMAQADMLYSNFDPDDTVSEKIAMYVDGNYWYNEAKLTFEEMEEIYGESANMNNRRFAFMPFPHAKAEDVGKKNVLVEDLRSVGMIKSNIEEYKIKAAKAFLQFCYTDESLQEFTMTTGAMKGVKYDLTAAQISSMNCFYKSLYDVRQNSDVVKSVSGNPIFFNNTESFFFGGFMDTKVNNKPYNVPSKAIKDSGVKAVAYYNGFQDKYTKSDWISKYQQYFVID